MIQIRKMKLHDLDQVMTIERQSFKTPWSMASFKAELKKKYGINLVADYQKEIKGYLVAWKIDHEMHIANLAVSKLWQRNGIATNLLRKLELDYNDVEWMGLEVRESNMAARALYQKLGFIHAGVRKDYYADEGEDAVLMVKEFERIIL